MNQILVQSLTKRLPRSSTLNSRVITPILNRPSAQTDEIGIYPSSPKSNKFSSKAAKSKKNKEKNVDEGVSLKDEQMQMVIRCLDAPMPPKPQLTDEQKEKHFNAGRNYVIGKFKNHNEMNHDLACKIKLKQHAIKMLPKDEGTTWKEEALKIDEDSFPPLWRNIPTDFPPMEGFDAEKFMDEEK